MNLIAQVSHFTNLTGHNFREFPLNTPPPHSSHIPCLVMYKFSRHIQAMYQPGTFQGIPPKIPLPLTHIVATGMYKFSRHIQLS